MDIENSFEFYILGLKDRYRGLALEAHLRSQSISFKNVWGLDGRDSSNAGFLESIVNQRLSKLYLGKELLMGEIACANYIIELILIFMLHDLNGHLYSRTTPSSFFGR